MKKTLITILAAVPALICAGACTDFLYEGEVDLTPKEEEEEFVYPTTYKFNHPCAYVTMDDINRAKAVAAAADETDPAYKCWLELCNSKYAVKGYTANPVEILVRGDPTGTGVSSQNVLNAGRDAAAAFELALRYQISGDTDYATTAVKILNDWAATCKKITSNDADFNLAAGFQGYQFANAAELLRDYDGWAEADQNAFRQWLIDRHRNLHGKSGNDNIRLPAVPRGRRQRGLAQHDPLCPGFRPCRPVIDPYSTMYGVRTRPGTCNSRFCRLRRIVPDGMEYRHRFLGHGGQFSAFDVRIHCDVQQQSLSDCRNAVHRIQLLHWLRMPEPDTRRHTYGCVF